MITIKNVTLKNFLSIGKVTQVVDFERSGLTLILGKNNDIGATNSRNGVGKSSLTQAISFALYGEPLTNIRLDNLINNVNGKSMLVTVDFERDGKTYRIERGRKPNVLRFYVNNTEMNIGDNAAQGENKQTQLEINHIIGMSHTLFKHLVILNTYTQPFLVLKPVEQREVIEELLGISQISQRDEVLKLQISATKESVKDEESKISAFNEVNNRINAAIEKSIQEQKSWNISHQRKIDDIKIQLEELSTIDFDKEISIFDEIDHWLILDKDLRNNKALHLSKTAQFDAELKRLKKEIASQKNLIGENFDSQITRLEQEILRCDTEAKKTPDIQVTRLRSDIMRRENECSLKLKLAKSKENELAELRSEIENLDGHSCSTCGQSLVGTDHLEKVLKNLTFKADKLVDEIKQCVIDADKFRKEIDEINDEIEFVVKSHAEKQAEWIDKANLVKDEIIALVAKQKLEEQKVAANVAELEKELFVVEDILNERDQLTKKFDAEILALGKKPVSNFNSREEVWKIREQTTKIIAEYDREYSLQNPHDVQIDLLRSTIQIIDLTVLHELQSTLKHQDFLHKLLSGKDSFIRKKIIDQNLSYLNSRMNKYLEAIGLPHEVRFMPDLSVDISMLGKQFDFEQLSRGERNRVVLATSWSFRDVWETMNTSLNLIFIDELVDAGIDQSGADAVVEVLNGMSRRKKNVFLVSHKESLIGAVSQVLMVHKENGFSRFEVDAQEMS